MLLKVRLVENSIPTASTIESSTCGNLLFQLRRPTPNDFKTPQIPPFQPSFFNRSLPTFEHHCSLPVLSAADLSAAINIASPMVS